MKQDDLLSVLREIQELVAKTLEGHQEAPKKDVRKLARTNAKARSLQDHILSLRDRGFFGQSKTVAEVYSKLQPVYGCERNRVTMALMRLSKHRGLRKTSKLVNKKQQTAYVW